MSKEIYRVSDICSIKVTNKETGEVLFESSEFPTDNIMDTNYNKIYNNAVNQLIDKKI